MSDTQVSQVHTFPHNSDANCVFDHSVYRANYKQAHHISNHSASRTGMGMRIYSLRTALWVSSMHISPSANTF
jgi:hypothetical protein